MNRRRASRGRAEDGYFPQDGRQRLARHLSDYPISTQSQFDVSYPSPYNGSVD